MSEPYTAHDLNQSILVGWLRQCPYCYGDLVKEVNRPKREGYVRGYYSTRSRHVGLVLETREGSPFLADQNAISLVMPAMELPR